MEATQVGPQISSTPSPGGTPKPFLLPDPLLCSLLPAWSAVLLSDLCLMLPAWSSALHFAPCPICCSAACLLHALPTATPRGYPCHLWHPCHRLASPGVEQGAKPYGAPLRTHLPALVSQFTVIKWHLSFSHHVIGLMCTMLFLHHADVLINAFAVPSQMLYRYLSILHQHCHLYHPNL